MEKNSENIPSNVPDLVLALEPISYVFPTSTVEPQEEMPESSSAEHLVERKQRDLSTSKVEKTYTVKFNLRQCSGVQETYILEMQEVETSNVSIHELTVHENDVQLKVLPGDQHIMFSPMVHIINRLHVKPISKLFLRERLGTWTVEQRKHNKSERRDKFYKHQKVQKKFRSLQEVAIFILFNCNRDDLQNPKAKTQTISNARDNDQ